MFYSLGKSINQNLATQFNLPRDTKVFSKAIIDGCLYATSEKVNKRSCNYYALLKDGTFIKILEFLVHYNNNQELLLCEVIETRPNNYNSIIKDVISINETICIETVHIEKICAFIEILDKKYIIPTPHLLSY